MKGLGSKVYQVIYTYDIDPNNFGKWIEKEIVFKPNASFYDEFMVGAAQLTGEDAYLAFDLILFC